MKHKYEDSHDHANKRHRDNGATTITTNTSAPTKQPHHGHHHHHRKNDEDVRSEMSYHTEKRISTPLSRTQSHSHSHHSRSSSIDDEVGHFYGHVGEAIVNRYVIEKVIGKGTFGKVFKCADKKYENDVVAVKVVRNIPKYVSSAKIEADILHVIYKHQKKRGVRHCVKLYSDFEYRGHYYMVFERLGLSIHDFLKMTDYQGFDASLIKDIARQLFEALDFLQSINLIHTDLKIENILFVDGYWRTKRDDGRMRMMPESSTIRLIDFGGATFDDDEDKSRIINTRQYRGPEVTLEVGWSFPSDIWSAGCIIAELFSGNLLFSTHEELEHLCLMEQCLGAFPTWMIDSTPIRSEFFNSHGELKFNELSHKSQRHVKKMPLLRDYFLENCVSCNRELAHNEDFLNLMEKVLRIDSKTRYTARDALNSSFFK